jgi:NADPH:quinone reductase-like Zn-dependent oxidoreductase
VTLVAKPKNSSEEAAGLPLTGLTAIQALRMLVLKRTIELFMHSGGVGSFALSMLKQARSYRIYTTTSSKM